MQKQFTNSQCSEDKYSLYSKTGRKLYRKLNNNIRVLNKSKLSNQSNQSIGSVALRRTQLSNDKIYSRQQEFIPINSSQVGVDFQTLYEIGTPKNSIPLTPLQSIDNYKQRLKQSLSQRSLRSDSQRSDKYKQSNYKKIRKQEIQKFLMFDDQKNKKTLLNEKKQIQSSRRVQRQNSRYLKQSMRSSRSKNISKNDLNQLQSLRSIKSSLKSQMKSPSSKNLKERRQNPDEYLNSNYQMKRLEQKYNKLYEGSSKNALRQKKDARQVKEIRKDGNDKYRQREREAYLESQRGKYEGNQRAQKQRQYDRDKNRNGLSRYKSEQYIGNNENQIYGQYLRSNKKKRTQQFQPSINDQYEKYYIQKNVNKKKVQQNEAINNDRKNKQIRQNQLERQNRRRKYEQESKYKDRQQNFRNQKRRKNTQNEWRVQQNSDNYSKNSRRDYIDGKVNKNYQGNDRRSILQMKSKYDRSAIKNIRIKNDSYSNLQYDKNSYKKYKPQSNYYNQSQKNYYQNRIKSSSKDRQIEKYSKNNQYDKNRSKKQKYAKNQYYNHFDTTYLDEECQNSIKNKNTQISQTFDSLILSINSRVTALNSQTSMQNVIQKVKLHMNTLNLISDYSQQFKKMYQQIDQWEQLIFLAYKKFWIQRSKTLNFIKKFKKLKRHESQRMGSSSSKKKIIGLKIATQKNIGSQNIRPQNENPFQNAQYSQNPFIIPFCKISEQEIKELARVEQGSILMQQLQKENEEIYQRLQQMYNLIITKSGNHINLHYCDNFSDEIYILMLQQIQQLIPNLQQYKVFEVTKIRLGKIVKAGILILFLNGKYIRNIAQIITYDDLQKIGNKRKIKTFTTYDLYYEVFEKLISQ